MPGETLNGVPAPPEDIAAHYAMTLPGMTLVVQAAADGDARVETRMDGVPSLEARVHPVPGERLIRRGGIDHIVHKDAQGSYSARRDDLIAMLAGMMRAAAPPQRPPPVGAPGLELVRAGEESVGGVPGILWRVQPAAAPAPIVAAEAVVSGDPALAVLGSAFAAWIDTFNAALRQVRGEDALENMSLEMMRLGAVLRLGKSIRLERLERTPIPADAFALAEPLLDRETLRVRYTAENDRLDALRRSGELPPEDPRFGGRRPALRPRTGA
ncbi:MAG: hypothetical protein WDN24_21795, partial [Sphingomonas sp.]